MIASIHTIADSIIIRKSLRWKSGIVNDEQIINCNSIYHRIEKLIESKLQKLSLNKNAGSVLPCILNIYSVKSSLEVIPWTVPWNLNDVERYNYLQDLDFYLMISGLLLRINNMLKGFISKCKNLSVVQMLPVIESHPKRVRQTIGLLDDSSWLRLVMYHKENNPFLREMQQLESNLHLLNEHGEFYKVVKGVYRTFDQIPVHLNEEERKASLLAGINKDIKQFVEAGSVLDLKSWSMYKRLMLIAVQSDEKNEMIDLYINSVQNLREKCKLSYSKEIRYIKKVVNKEKKIGSGKKYVNWDYVIKLETIKEDLLKYEQKKVAGEPEDFIEWTYNPKEFVKCVYALIAKGYITVKGNSDIYPIVEVLSKFVKVRKQNGSGYLSFDTLLTYFRKAHAGEL